jgi:hypothetical protein
LPKRTKGKLAVKPIGRTPGWGIFFEEGWDLAKISSIVVLVVLGSLLFGLLWAVLKKDAQGAFGISAWWATVCSCILALFAIKSSRE